MDVDNSKLTYIVFASMIMMKLLPQGINFSKSQVQTKYSRFVSSLLNKPRLLHRGKKKLVCSEKNPTKCVEKKSLFCLGGFAQVSQPCTFLHIQFSALASFDEVMWRELLEC